MGLALSTNKGNWISHKASLSKHDGIGTGLGGIGGTIASVSGRFAQSLDVRHAATGTGLDGIGRDWCRIGAGLVPDGVELVWNCLEVVQDWCGIG